MMRPYIYVTRLDGVMYTVFTRYIVLVEPAARHPGTVMRMTDNGTVSIDMRETYEEVMRLINGAPMAKEQPQCICGGEPHVSACPANRDPFLRGPL
jgi:hypothetical protein